MRVILFQKRFVTKILDGSKHTTIRVHARCKPGDALSLRTWEDKPYRSKQRILRTEICHGVQPIHFGVEDSYRVYARFERHDLAITEGFRDWPDMRDWFESNHGLPFGGELISWMPTKEGITPRASQRSSNEVSCE